MTNPGGEVVHRPGGVNHDLGDALKRCNGELRAVLEELRARGAPDDAREVVERWRHRLVKGGWEGRSVAGYPPSTEQ